MDRTEADRVVLAWYSKLLLDAVEQVRIYQHIRREYPNFWALHSYPHLLGTLRSRLEAVLYEAAKL